MHTRAPDWLHHTQRHKPLILITLDRWCISQFAMLRSARAGASAAMDLSALLQPLPDWEASSSPQKPLQQLPSDGVRTQRQQPSASSPSHIIRLHRTGSFEVERVQSPSPSSSRHVHRDEHTVMQTTAELDAEDAFWCERANNVAKMWHTTAGTPTASTTAAAAAAGQPINTKQQQQQSSLTLDATGTRATHIVNETQLSPQPAASPFETYATGDSHMNTGSVRFDSVNGSQIRTAHIDAFGLPNSEAHRQHDDMYNHNSQRLSLRSSGNRGTMQSRCDQHELVPALLHAVGAMMSSLKNTLASDSAQQLNTSTATAALDSTTDTISYFVNADAIKAHIQAVQAMCLRAKRNVHNSDEFTQCVIDVSETCCSAVAESINSIHNERQQSAVLLKKCQAQMAQLHIANQKAVKEAVKQERFNAAAKAASLSKHSSDNEAILQDKLTQLQQQLSAALTSTDATTKQLRHDLAAATAREHSLQEQLQRLETDQTDTIAEAIRTQKAAMERKAAQDVDTMRTAVQKLREQAESERQSIRRDMNAKLAETQHKHKTLYGKQKLKLL
jgi:hypothetical protein